VPFTSFKPLDVTGKLTVLSISVSSRFIFRKPAVRPCLIAELLINEVVTMLAFGKLAVLARQPFGPIASGSGRGFSFSNGWLKLFNQSLNECDALDPVHF
jgi:hypothetical protein